jgi:hypothetical protein
MVPTSADYVDIDPAQAADTTRAALAQYNLQILSDGDIAENSNGPQPPKQTSSATLMLDFYETAVDKYEHRLQTAQETIQELKDDIKRREQAENEKAKATDTIRRVAVSTIQKRDKQILGLRVIYKALLAIDRTNSTKIEKLERDVRNRDSAIDYLQKKLLKVEESQQSSEPGDEAGNAISID